MPFDWKSLTKMPKWLWALGLLGAFLLFGGTWFSPMEQKPTPPKTDSEQTSASTEHSSIHDFEQMYEIRLSTMLNQLPGISDVSVMVNIDSTEEVQYATNDQENKQTTNETDKQGGTRVTTQLTQNNQLVVMKNGDGDHPVVMKTIKPRVRGVLVVAKGAENVRAQAAITDAVQRVLDIPPFKISIQPKKQ